MPVDLLDPPDGPVGVFGRPEGGVADKGGGAAEPTERVVRVVGVVGHAGHDEWMQGLEQQGAEASYDHRRQVSVDPAGHRIGLEEGQVGVFGAFDGSARQPE